MNNGSFGISDDFTLTEDAQTDSEVGGERHRNWADEVEGEQERLNGYYRRGGIVP